jgi:hypothetical protein
VSSDAGYTPPRPVRRLASPLYQFDWRDLPENQWRSPLRRDWIDELATDCERDPEQFLERLCYALHGSYVADGMDGETASRIALRAAQVARLMLEHYQQREIAPLFEVSVATVKKDIRRVRELVDRGELDSYHGRRLRPFPALSDARLVVPTEPPARLRRRR